MEPSRAQAASLRASIHRPRPVWPNAPAPQVFLPLVSIACVVLPGLYLWLESTLTLTQAAWGLATLQTAQGDIRLPTWNDQPVAPLFVWVNLLTQPGFQWLPLWPSGLATYFFGLVALLLVYRLGRLWFSPSTGLLTALLVAVNQVFLENLRTGHPSILVMAFGLLVLLAYVEHLRADADVFSRWTWIGVFGQMGLLLASGVTTFWLPTLGLANLVFQRAERRATWRETSWALVRNPTTLAGIVVVAVGSLLASPWIVTGVLLEGWRSGSFSPWLEPGGTVVPENQVWWRLLIAMPATAVLALAGTLQAVLDCSRPGPVAARASLPLLWTLLGATALLLQPGHAAAMLLTIVPATMLAVRVLLDILSRNLTDRAILGLIVGSIVCFVCCRSSALIHLPAWWFSYYPLSDSDKLRAHLALDFLIFGLLAVIWIFRWSEGSDWRRRALFGAFVLLTIAGASTPSLAHLDGGPRRLDAWRTTREQLERLPKADVVAFVTREKVDPRLEYVTRGLWPKARWIEAPRWEKVETSLSTAVQTPVIIVNDVQNQPESRPLVQRQTPLNLYRYFDGPSFVVYAITPMGPSNVVVNP